MFKKFNSFLKNLTVILICYPGPSIHQFYQRIKVMKEFMLLIHNDANSKLTFTPDREREFLNACGGYIENLKKRDQLISAQPLVREGIMLSGHDGQWEKGPYREGKEVIVGYYHIKTNDLDQAIVIAKGNPEFEYSQTARIEVRPIKMKEEATGYLYPVG
jgi:hypothetical protein